VDAESPVVCYDELSPEFIGNVGGYAKESTMMRISTFCAVSGALAVLALCADGAAAATLVPATPKPVVPKVSAPQPKVYGKDIATGVIGRPKASPKTKSYKGYVEISSFSFGVTHQSTIGSATGGAGAGKASLGQLQINKVKGKSKIKNGIILNSFSPPSH
jgi:hypothetical protein